MLKYKIILLLLLATLIMTPAYSQVKPDNHQIKVISGTVINVDSVGNVITIRTEDQKQVTFSVVDKVNITQEAHDIGLMDIRETDPVSIQYYVSSPGKNVVISITDNKVIGG